MKKLFNKKAFALVLCLVLALTAMMTVTAFADTEPADGAAVSETAETAADSVTGTKAMASAIAIGIAAAAGAIGMGMAIAKSAEGISRQPEAEGKIRTTMMLGLVFLETVVIYALLTVILIIFTNRQHTVITCTRHKQCKTNMFIRLITGCHVNLS